jgi:hypothetical protein
VKIREEEIMEDIRFRMGPIFFRSGSILIASRFILPCFFYVYKKWW